MGSPRKWTDEQLVAAVTEARSMTHLMRLLGLAHSGSSHAALRGHIDRIGLKTPLMDRSVYGDHFRKDDQAWIEANCVEHSHKMGPVLRRRLVSGGILEDRCYRCGITEWMGEPAPLQIEHKNGNPTDNRIENLTILCSNCHCLTPTWGRKKRLSRMV